MSAPRARVNACHAPCWPQVCRVPPWMVFGPPRGGFWGPLGVAFGRSWAVLEPYWGLLRGQLGACRAIVEPILGFQWGARTLVDPLGNFKTSRQSNSN